MFETLERPESAVDGCARAIREAILRGELAIGSKLPPERALAETFGVNRVTLRSALTRLAQARLLSVRQGSGYLVRDYEQDGGPDLLPGLTHLAQERGELAQVAADLLLMRRTMARAVLERLSQLERIDCSGIAEALQGFRDAAANTSTGSADGMMLARADLAVVAAVVDATDSAVLRLCMNPITQVVMSTAPLRAAMYAEPATNVAGYEALLQWCQQPNRAALPGLLEVLEQRDALTIQRLASQEAG